MNSTDLLRMSDQIARFFARYPEDQAVSEIASHFNHYWDPAMRRDLQKAVAVQPANFHPLVIRAMSLLQNPS